MTRVPMNPEMRAEQELREVREETCALREEMKALVSTVLRGNERLAKLATRDDRWVFNRKKWIWEWKD
jgi:hypothetical protein